MMVAVCVDALNNGVSAFCESVRNSKKVNMFQEFGSVGDINNEFCVVR